MSLRTLEESEISQIDYSRSVKLENVFIDEENGNVVINDEKFFQYKAEQEVKYMKIMEHIKTLTGKKAKSEFVLIYFQGMCLRQNSEIPRELPKELNTNSKLSNFLSEEMPKLYNTELASFLVSGEDYGLITEIVNYYHL